MKKSAKPIKFRKIRNKRRAFCSWQQPVMKKYFLSCCDCGLVHEMQFRIVGVKKPVVQFRCRRAEGLTATHRKAERITVRHHPSKREKA